MLCWPSEERKKKGARIRFLGQITASPNADHGGYLKPSIYHVALFIRMPRNLQTLIQGLNCVSENSTLKWLLQWGNFVAQLTHCTSLISNFELYLQKRQQSVIKEQINKLQAAAQINAIIKVQMKSSFQFDLRKNNALH